MLHLYSFLFVLIVNVCGASFSKYFLNMLVSKLKVEFKLVYSYAFLNI